MELVCHGGNCCGVKTIKGFTFGPEYNECPVIKKSPNNKDKCGHHVSSAESFFTDAAPAETSLSRLKRFLEFLKRERPEGLVEAYLIRNQVNLWDKHLKDLGFKTDKPFKNSNSGNLITRYWLVMKPEAKPKLGKQQAPLREMIAIETPATEMIDVQTEPATPRRRAQARNASAQQTA